MKEFKNLIEDTQKIKNKIAKQINRLQKIYNNAFEWFFTPVKDSGYIITLCWFDDSLTKITPVFDSYDINFELMPISYIKGNMYNNTYKSIKNLIEQEAKTKLR